MPSLEEFASAEYSTACTDLSRISPQEAVIKFYARQDSAIKTSTDRSLTKPACRSGCSYCCYYKVVAKAVEVIAIQQFVVSRFKPEQLTAAIAQAERNVAEASGLSHAEHLALNQQCPFLLEDKCSIYLVRPSKCRSFHASDVEGCRVSYEDPQCTVPNSYILEVFEAANGVSEGFNAAIRKSGVDSRTYDLNSAFLDAMQNSGASKRLKGGKRDS